MDKGLEFWARMLAQPQGCGKQPRLQDRKAQFTQQLIDQGYPRTDAEETARKAASRAHDRGEH